ncbi:hypothetical protein [uncultured Maribacter sp.]|uniref:hypothetical protein n=1 Tax=uncultured Maribacter sp. TaxID=431308 RepID=UPI002616E153|nr:hypothetical protein [uncultured Maribacter sp.]
MQKITPHQVSKKFAFSFLFILTFILGCSKDDTPFVDAENTVDLEAVFYGKTWAIHEIEVNGNRVAVPEEGECGRDYFRYFESGKYIEYLHQSSSCFPEINRLNFTLDGSTITLFDEIEGEAEIRIQKLDETEFNFETHLDVDGDGNNDKVKLYCRIYSPEDRDFYSETFEKDFFKFQDDNLIAFTWSEYVGDDFKQYEIYRSSGSCNKTDAIQIATITDLSQNEFIDLDPDPVEELCYFFRLQTNKGQLAESDMISINTRDIDVFKTEMLAPEVLNGTIKLNWLPFTNPYFSRYEITVSKKAYYDNSPEEILVATVENQESNTLTLEIPPSIEDPFFNIHVYNIFGERSSLNIGQDFTDPSVEVIYTPQEMVDMMSVHLIGSDPTDSRYLYLWGENVSDPYKKIKKVDITTKEVVATSSFDLNTSSEVRLKVFESPEGKEVFIQKGSEYHVFDALSLDYKYRFRDLNDEYIGFEDLLHFKDDIWVIADGGDELRTVRRFGRDLQTIDVLDPKPTTIFKRMYDLIRLGENQILGGMIYDDKSFLFEINDDGTIVGSNEVGYSFTDRSRSILHSGVSNILLDKRNLRIYSANDYDFISSYSSPVHTSSISIDGEHILGTDYNGDDSLDFFDVFDRELNILKWSNGQNIRIATVGYPQYVYENSEGKLVVISSYFKRSSFRRGDTKNDLFVEVIDW